MTDNITLFSHILPEEQERMRVCFQAREILYKNNEIIMEYSDSMTKIGLILEGQATLYCCDIDGTEYIMDELHSFSPETHCIIMSAPDPEHGSCLLTTSM